jgi:hypothetical protein
LYRSRVIMRRKGSCGARITEHEEPISAAWAISTSKVYLVMWRLKTWMKNLSVPLVLSPHVNYFWSCKH